MLGSGTNLPPGTSVAEMSPLLRQERRNRSHGFLGVMCACSGANGSATVFEVDGPHHCVSAPVDRAQSDTQCVLLHGELLGGAALRRDLGIGSTVTPPHVLLAAWKRWGVETFRRISGPHAIVVRDGDDLYAYRDRIGTRPLYLYTGLRNAIAFASQLSALWTIPGVEARPDRQSLYEYLRFLDIAAPYTWYEDVLAVRAGEVLRWSATTRQLSTVPMSNICEVPSSLTEAVDMLDARLQSSVATCLADAVAPACFLSSGIDSSLLCAIAARLRPNTCAVSVGFTGTPVDESVAAARIAAHLGLEHQVLQFKQDDYERALLDLGCTADQPMADPAVLPTVLAFQHCHERFDTAIDGSGADEAFGLMPARHVRIGVEYASRLPPSWRRTLVRLTRHVRPLSPYAVVADFDHPAETMIRWKGFSRPQIESLCREPVSLARTSFYQTFERFPLGAHFDRYSALLDTMPCDRLSQAVQVSGLNARFPYADPSVDLFVRALPKPLRYQTSEPKRALRHVLARHLPRDLWDAPKHGFTFPLWDFLAANDFAVVRRYLGCGSLFAPISLAGDVVQDLLNRVTRGDRDSAFRAWALVVLGAWLEGHAAPTSAHA